MKNEKFLNQFLEEAKEILLKINQSLLESEKKEKIDFSILARLGHTLKGSATLMGFTEMAQLAHELENVFSEKQINFPKAFDLIDQIQNFLSHFKKNEDAYLKLPVSRIDELLYLIGEMMIFKVRLQQKVNELKEIVSLNQHVRKEIHSASSKEFSSSLSSFMNFFSEKFLSSALW